MGQTHSLSRDAIIFLADCDCFSTRNLGWAATPVGHTGALCLVPNRDCFTSGGGVAGGGAGGVAVVRQPSRCVLHGTWHFLGSLEMKMSFPDNSELEVLHSCHLSAPKTLTLHTEIVPA